MRSIFWRGFEMSRSTAKTLRKTMIEAERRLWRALKKINISHTHFRRQVPIGSYVADFACHSARLVVEVDGGQHGQDRSAIHDSERTAFLETRGYKVIRFWNHEVMNDLQVVLETIHMKCRSAWAGNPHPKNASRFSTSPQRGG